MNGGARTSGPRLAGPGGPAPPRGRVRCPSLAAARPAQHEAVSSPAAGIPHTSFARQSVCFAAKPSVTVPQHASISTRVYCERNSSSYSSSTGSASLTLNFSKCATIPASFPAVSRCSTSPATHACNRQHSCSCIAAAAIDEALHHMPHLGDVKMRRREPAIGQPQRDMEIGVGRQRGAEVEERLHILDFGF